MSYVDYFGMDVVPDPIPTVHQISMTVHIEPGAFIAIQISTPTNTWHLGQYPPFVAAYYRVTTPLVGGLQPIAVPPGGVVDAFQPVVDTRALAGLLPAGVKMDANTIYGPSAAPIACADCLSTSTARRFHISPPGVAHPQACLPTFFDVTEPPCSPLNLFPLTVQWMQSLLHSPAVTSLRTQVISFLIILLIF